MSNTAGTLSIVCTPCGARLRFPAAAVGRNLTCSNCGSGILVAVPKIRIQCTGCGSHLRVPESSAGKRVKCPSCETPVSVKAPPAADGDFRIIEELPDVPPPGPVPRRPSIGEDEPNFLRTLPTAFTYPVSNWSGKLFFPIFGLMWGAIWFSFGLFGTVIFGWGIWLARILLGGYIASFMWNILFDTVGKDRGPQWPDVTNLGELVGNFFRFFGAAVMAYLPLIVLVIYGLISPSFAGSGVFEPLFWTLGVFGTLYYPMALMMIGFTENLLAPLNYFAGIRSILRIPGQYAVCALFFVATFVGAILLLGSTMSYLPEDEILTPLMALGVMGIIALYLYAVQMRALGLLYASTKRRLAWFRRP